MSAFNVHLISELIFWIENDQRKSFKLRLTGRIIINIFAQYQLKSQQSLKQCFKAYFSITPVAYHCGKVKKVHGSGVAALADGMLAPVSFLVR